MAQTTIGDEWLSGALKRLEIAKSTRFTNPAVTLNVLIDVVEELLQRKT
jgi:hypothetical protein